MSDKALFGLILVIIVLSILAAVNLTGDPAAIDRAKARQIERQAEAEAQARQAAEERKQADWQATKAAKDLGKRAFFTLAGVAGALALAAILLTVAFRAWQASGAAARGWAVYTEQRAALAAGTIKLDKETRTFPALVAGGAIHNLETGQVYLLGQRQNADPQQVTASAQVRAIGVTAQAAERIGKSAKDARAADALPGVSASTPLVSPAERLAALLESQPDLERGDR